MKRIFSSLLMVILFLMNSILMFPFEISNDKKEKKSFRFEKLDIDTGTIKYFLDNTSHLWEDRIKDPFKIITNWGLIKRKPERVADALLELMSKMSEEEQRRVLENYGGYIAVLLKELDSRSSVKFEPVLEILTKNKFYIDPNNIENLRPIAENLINRYVEDYNNTVKRLPPDLRSAVPEISTKTINYENTINRLVEFTRKIRASPNNVVQSAEKLSVNYSTNVSVHNTLSYLFLENSSFDEAEKYATKAIELDRNNIDAYLLRSQARYSLKNIKGAIEDIKRASEIDPSDETVKLLSSYFATKHDFNSSKVSEIKDSFLGNELMPESKLHSTSAKVKLKSENLEDIDKLPNEITNEEKKSLHYLKMAQIKSEMKDYKEALKYVNRAIEKNPSNLDAYLERANINNLIGNYDEAINDATYVLRYDPHNIFALNIRAWALYKKGELENAYLDTSRAIDLKPNFADAMFLRALIYEKQSKYDEMLNDLEKASKINPSYTPYFKDAVASYSYRAPNFLRYYDRNRDIFDPIKQSEAFNIKRFLVLLILTVIGGVIIGISLLHIFSPRIAHVTKTSSISTPDIITPNIFYEGVATGKYKIIKKIGQGGMGSVYLAIDQSLNREVAIKKMNEDIKMNEREKQRFIEEARTVAMLHHPNIIEIYTIFEEKGDIYLVFEYIDGMSLDKKLDISVRMPFFEVKPIIIDIAKALKYAHSKNVVHRDLKLSNVMISNDGIVKVTDFGLAKVIREAKAKYSSAEVVGSPAYMAPEQDLGIFLKESDLYSLGVCLYELLSGELPFLGPDYHYQKERKLYTPLSHIVVGLPKDIDRIVSKLLEPDPQYRYHSVDEFLHDFDKLS